MRPRIEADGQRRPAPAQIGLCVHNLLGYSYRNAGRIDDALREYEIALDLDPNHRGAHETIGIAYLSAKQPDKARQHLATLEHIRGNTNCEEYRDLADAIAAYTP